MLVYMLFFFIFFFVQSVPRISSEPVSYWCNNTHTSAPASNAAYRSTLKSLLSALSANATGGTGFYNTTAGGGDATTYGLYMCQGGVSASACAACVRSSGADILRRCPYQETAVAWYDACLLRYSDRPVFGRLDRSVPFVLYSQYGPKPEKFMVRVGIVMVKMANRMISERRRYATEEDEYAAPAAGKKTAIYSAGQCTPDLSDSDCQECIYGCIRQLVSMEGNRVLYPSCSVRYEVYRFYNTAAAASPPLPSRHPTPPSTGKKGNPSSSKAIIIIIIIIIIVLVTGMVFTLSVLCCVRIRNAKKKNDTPLIPDVARISSVDSSQYDYATLQAITNDFSSQSKIGQGGYGFVYKGKLPNGQEVAIKRLSKSSTQGVQEFKNEVEVVAKLQHRNLVKLLGYCSQGEERILVYEFVPNKSLDYFLFVKENRYILDWSRRYKIIGGIARGLLYLHEDSRLKIIHRDLKASNILLDADLNPKIADFGMARIVLVDQTKENTNTIVGTFGYMSPEYAMHGDFSVKSDVFSFGVLLLEIINGKKNNNFYQSNGSQDLGSYAWEQWVNGTPLEMVDPALGECYKAEEAMQCIHIGLLCVQESAEKRPTMAQVISMLSSSYSYSSVVGTWPTPSHPAFYATSSDDDDDVSTADIIAA